MSTFPNDMMDPAEAPSQRTSVLAIFGLVLGILSIPICCLPGIGPIIAIIAICLSIFSMFKIVRAGGMLRGRGLAVGGIVTGLLGLLAGSVVLLGLNYAANQFGQYAVVVKEVQKDDPSGAAALLTQDAATAVSPESIAAFRDATKTSIGDFSGVNGGLLPWIDSAGVRMNVAESDLRQHYMNGMMMKGGLQPMPVPIKGSTGNATLLVIADPSSATSSFPLGRIANVALIPHDGTPHIWLVPHTSTLAPFQPPAPIDPASNTPADPAKDPEKEGQKKEGQ